MLNKKDTLTFDEWRDNLSLEETVMMRIMDAYLEDCYNYDPVDKDYVFENMVTTTEIMDATCDIGPLTVDFINKYMVYLGYRLSKQSGRVTWHIWR